MLSFHVESESETILVEQVLEESPVVTGFDICGTDLEPEIVNEGKPRFMHLNHYLVYFEKFITYVTYCIKLFNSNITYLMHYLPCYSFTILEDVFIYKGVDCLVCFMVGFQSKSFDTIKDSILAEERKKVE